jgi:hypothetical protein
MFLTFNRFDRLAASALGSVRLEKYLKTNQRDSNLDHAQKHS